MILSYLLTVFLWQPLILSIKTVNLLRKFKSKKEDDMITEGRFYWEPDMLIKLGNISGNQETELAIVYKDDNDNNDSDYNISTSIDELGVNKK